MLSLYLPIYRLNRRPALALCGPLLEAGTFLAYSAVDPTQHLTTTSSTRL